MPTKGAPERPAIAITGIGLLASQAQTPAELWALARCGRSPAQIRPPDDQLPALAICPVADPLPELPVKLRRAHRSDRTVRMSLSAGWSAWQESGLASQNLSPQEVAVVVGTSRGPYQKWLEVAALAFGNSSRPTRLLPSLAAESASASLHGSLAALIGAQGPAYTVSTACASGAHAIALAADHLLSGSATCALVGGVDAPLHPLLIRQFLATRILDPRLPPEPACRPFDRSAQGTLLGEAAAFLVLETLASATARRAPMQGLLIGWGIAADGKSASAEAAGAVGLPAAVMRALQRAGCRPADLGYINVHGTGTRHNDDLEMAWLHELTAASGPIPYSSTKPVTGHCLGATPVLEAIISLQTLSAGILPPNPHCPDPHPNAPPGLVRELNQPLLQPRVLSTSLGFWGASAALLFSSHH